MGTLGSTSSVAQSDGAETPLEAALGGCDADAVAELVRRGVDVNRRSADGRTPLMIIAGLGHVPLASLLLAAGADVLAIEPRMGATALHKAAQSGDPGMIALLLEHGAFIDQQSPILGNTPLIDAVLHRSEDGVRTLLERGARTGIANHWQQTAAVLARENGTHEITALIEARDRADAERLAGLCLVAAAKAGDLGSVRRLIADDARLDERVAVTGTLDDNYTPLGVATREGHVEVVRMLLEAGSDPLEPIGLMGGTSVHEASYFGRADIVRLFTGDTGDGDALLIDLDDQGAYNGFTALHDAVWHGHMEAVQALIAASARCDLRTHTGLTPRGLALLYGYDEIARFLEKAEGGRSASTLQRHRLAQ